MMQLIIGIWDVLKVIFIALKTIDGSSILSAPANLIIKKKFAIINE